MDKRLGIAIYPEIVGNEATLEYIELAHKHGFKRIFANLIAVENNAEGNAKLKARAEVYKRAKALGFDVILDVNPNFYKAFKLPPTTIKFFEDLGATGIRLDEDFAGEVEGKLASNDHGFKVELNNSSGLNTLRLTLDKGGKPENVWTCHNFYPMRYTGLKYERFIENSAATQAWGVRTAAFITLPESQKRIGPWDIDEGMPTLEEHRNLPLRDQLAHMLSLNVIDDIIIAQQGATSAQMAELKYLLDEYNAVERTKLVELRVKVLPSISPVERDIAFVNKGKDHFNRPDYNGYFVRSTFSRIDYKEDAIKPREAGKALKLGDVVILNEKLGRYKGELHVMLRDLDDSQQKARNLIARVVPEDLFKVTLITGGKKFKLVIA